MLSWLIILTNMSKRCQDILYFPLYALFCVLSWLPLSALYVVSRLLYYIIYYVVRYRRKVTRDNMAKAFPDKSDAELSQMERDFYRYFTDYMVETIKLLHISDAEMRRRMEFVDAEVVDRFTSQGRPVMLLLGHYGNWEWIPSLTMWCKMGDNIAGGQIYRPLSNKWFDAFFLRLRSRFGTVGIPSQSTLRTLLQYRREGKVSVTGFISDQAPRWSHDYQWTTLFGRRTTVITGYETIAKKLDMAVVYVDVELIKRGYYRATFRLLEENPAQCPEQDIVERYIQSLEKTIRRKPHAWLWTHDRWKQSPND